MEPGVELAKHLLAPYLPENTHLEIEVFTNHCSYPVVMRLIYTSPRSGKTMAVMAKGASLPIIDDEILRFYATQLVLSPQDIRVRFSRLAFYERRARQDAWLALGKSSRREDGKGDTIRLHDEADRADTLSAVEYSTEAAYDQHDNLTNTERGEV